MDMTSTIIPRSDQVNADDLMAGPRTVTIEKVSAGSAEQPVDVFLIEFPGRAFRPSKSMRRVMVAAWGAETSAYTGRRMTLYRDPSIRFGKDEVGGIRISHMSHINKTLKLALTVSRGRREAFTVEPLADAKRVDTKSAEIVDSVGQPSELVDKGADTVAGMNAAQHEQIGALFSKLHLTDTAAQLAYVSDCVERPVTGANQLSSYEAARVIEYLLKDEAQGVLKDEVDGV